MGTPRFRVYFGDRPASAEALANIEEIVVEQEMDMIWEARIRFAMCLDEQGRWRDPPEGFAEPFSRMRVELDPGSGRFAPLIDGPVASFDTTLDSQPGSSTVSLVVRDDSVFLNREENTEVFEDRLDSDIAREVFEGFGQIDSTRIEATEGEHVAVRRGTAMQFLRELARANGRFHAYVLPGEEPGKSIGCFLPDPTEPSTLPPLELFGEARNLAEATITDEREDPQRTRGRTLRISDQSIVSTEVNTSDLELMRALPAVPDDVSALRELPPEDNNREDPEPRAQGETGRAAYAFRMTARIVPGCYPLALAPYQKIRLCAGTTGYSGACLIVKVTHRITPSVYTQEIEAKGDSLSEREPAASAAAAPGGGLSVSFSASVGIF